MLTVSPSAMPASSRSNSGFRRLPLNKTDYSKRDCATGGNLDDTPAAAHGEGKREVVDVVLQAVERRLHRRWKIANPRLHGSFQTSRPCQSTADKNGYNLTFTTRDEESFAHIQNYPTV